MSKITVIHHSADFDGLFCREIARKFLPDAELIGWDFGDKPLAVPKDGQIYVMDLPVDRVFGFDFCKSETLPFINHPVEHGADKLKQFFGKLIWIDHHKSSIETHPTDIPGCRIDGVAACRLAWQWFTMVDGNTPRVGAEIGLPIRPAGVLPMIQDYKNREVNEPLAVRLAGEYDIWDKRDPRAELFQFGLRSRLLTAFDWNDMLSMQKPTIEEIERLIDVGHDKNLLEPDGTFAGAVIHGLLESGKVLQFAREQEYAEVITQQGFDLEFEGVKFLACNSHELDIRSHLFAAGIKPHHEALLGFTFTGKDWRVSMYRIDGKEADILSIARKNGGGGHAGACGFRPSKLPWILL